MLLYYLLFSLYITNFLYIIGCIYRLRFVFSIKSFSVRFNFQNSFRGFVLRWNSFSKIRFRVFVWISFSWFVLVDGSKKGIFQLSRSYMEGYIYFSPYIWFFWIFVSLLCFPGVLSVFLPFWSILLVYSSLLLCFWNLNQSQKPTSNTS